MKKADHSEALVRLVAIALAKGDEKVATRYLQWAYAPVLEKDVERKRTNPSPAKTKRTEKFIANELCTDAVVTLDRSEKFIGKYILRRSSLDYDAIYKHIRGMKYQDFLKTPYWAGIALFVRKRDGKKCSVCGRKDGILDVHHKTYDHHGDELHHLDDLSCVCRECHAKEHEKR